MCHPISLLALAGNVETLRSPGIQVCSMANNHVLDWCEPGLLETLDTLEQAGMQKYILAAWLLAPSRGQGSLVSGVQASICYAWRYLCGMPRS